MIATEAEIIALIKKVNQTVFDGMLPIDLIDIDIEFQDDVWGYCIPHDEVDGRILLGVTDHFEDKIQFVDTVVHELVHAMQIYNEVRVGHDTKLWNHYVQKAEDAGYHIQIIF